MDLTEGSETSAKLNLTPGKCLKENTQVSENRRKSEIKNSPSFPTIKIILNKEKHWAVFLFHDARLPSLNYKNRNFGR
jgi:hypothetical protein